MCEETNEQYNAALWVANDEDLYYLAMEYDEDAFAELLDEMRFVTPDGCSLHGSVGGELARYAWRSVHEDDDKEVNHGST